MWIVVLMLEGNIGGSLDVCVSTARGSLLVEDECKGCGWDTQSVKYIYMSTTYFVGTDTLSASLC